MANGQVSLRAAPLHYFHVADCGMDLGGIISRRYSRWRSTAEEDLCTARLGLTKGKAPPVLMGVFFQAALPLPAGLPT